MFHGFNEEEMLGERIPDHDIRLRSRQRLSSRLPHNSARPRMLTVARKLPLMETPGFRPFRLCLHTAPRFDGSPVSPRARALKVNCLIWMNSSSAEARVLLGPRSMNSREIRRTLFWYHWSGIITLNVGKD